MVLGAQDIFPGLVTSECARQPRQWRRKVCLTWDPFVAQRVVACFAFRSLKYKQAPMRLGPVSTVSKHNCGHCAISALIHLQERDSNQSPQTSGPVIKKVDRPPPPNLNRKFYVGDGC